MKTQAFRIVFFIVLLTFSTASANRVIVKNANDLRTINDGRLIRNFNIGKNTYSVIEMKSIIRSRFQLSSLAYELSAQSAFEDLKVIIDRPEIEEVTETTAWHVEELKYGELSTTLNGEGVIVAVIDSGVDYKHKALSSHIWKNKNEIPGNNIDDDENGYVDDIVGYDFAQGDNDPLEVGSSGLHGTHVSGIIVADLDEESGAKGIAQGVKIMPVRNIGGDHESFLSNTVEAIIYAVDNGADILNNSWRIYDEWSKYNFNINIEGKKLLKDAILYAEEHDVLFVNCAGNERKHNDLYLDEMEPGLLPGGYLGLSNLVVVASADKGQTVSTSTNYGKKSVAIAAPGSYIFSTFPQNSWGNMSGTSMAAPLVSGALAIGISSGLSPQEAIAALIDTANITELWTPLVQSGHINLLNYIDSL